jgi:hypothetical protein
LLPDGYGKIRDWWEENYGKEIRIKCPDCERKAAPKREWVGLTSDNFNDFNPLFKAEEAVRWAEAKLKEKNHG